MNWYVRSILALVAVSLQAATTTVTGTYNTVEGRPANGTVVVEVTRAFTATDGKAVPVQRKVYQIKGGQLSIALEPNSGSTPESFYTITTTIDGGPPENTIWIVPVSSTPVTVASVVSSAPPTASQTIPPQQIRGTGASVGDTLTFNGSNYAPAPVAPGGVTSVNTQTGDVVLTPGDIGAQAALGFTPENAANKNASNGYAGLSGGLLSNSQIPTAIDAAKLADGSVSNAELQRIDGLTSNAQTQLNAKQPKRSEVALDDYCTTPGTYDGSCWTNAISANPSGTKFYVGGHTYTSSVKIVNNSKTDLAFYSNDQTATLKAANGLNDDLIAFTSCHRCSIEGFTLDGNGANQTAGYAFHSVTSNFIQIKKMTFTNPYAANAKIEEVAFSGQPGAATVTGNTFKNRSGTITKGILNENSNSFTLTDNTFECYIESCVDLTSVAGGAVSRNTFQLLDSTSYTLYYSQTPIKMTVGTPFTPLRVDFGTVGTANGGTDSSGNTWIGTCGIYTSTVSSLPNAGTTIAGADPADQFIYNTGARRSSGSSILIDFNTSASSHQACPANFLTAGKFTLKFHFADYLSSGAGQNVQNVNISIGGGGAVTTLESNLDIFAQAGGAFKKLVKSYPVYVYPTGSTTTHFNIHMTRVTGSASITGLEIIPMPASAVTITPVNLMEEFTAASQTKVITPSVTGGVTNQIRCILQNTQFTPNFTVSTINGNTQCQVTSSASVSSPFSMNVLMIQSLDDPAYGEVVILGVNLSAMPSHISPSTTVTLAQGGTQAFTGSYTGGGNPWLNWATTPSFNSGTMSTAGPTNTSTFTAPASIGAPMYNVVFAYTNLYDYGMIKFNSFNNSGIEVSNNQQNGLSFNVRSWIGMASGASVNGGGTLFANNKSNVQFGTQSAPSFDGYMASQSAPSSYVLIGPSTAQLCTINTCVASSLYSTFSEVYPVPIAACQNGTAVAQVGTGGTVLPTFTCLTNVPYAAFSKTTDGYIYFEHSPRRTTTSLTTTSTSTVNPSDFLSFGGYYSTSASGTAAMKMEMACAYGGTTNLSSLTWRILGIIGPTASHLSPLLNYSGRSSYNSGTWTTYSQLASDNCFQDGASSPFQVRWYFRLSRDISNANDTNTADFRVTNISIAGRYANAQ